jgi:hypothetical protein
MTFNMAVHGMRLIPIEYMPESFFAGKVGGQISDFLETSELDCPWHVKSNPARIQSRYLRIVIADYATPSLVP